LPPTAKQSAHPRLVLEDAILTASDLSPSARLLGLVLRAHMKNRDDGAECWVRVSVLAREMGVSPSTVQRARAELVAGGYVEVVGRSGRANVWRVHPDLLSEPLALMRPTPSTHDRGPLAPVRPITRFSEPEREEPEERCITIDECHDLFFRATDAGLTSDDFDELLVSMTGKPAALDLTLDERDAVLEKIERRAA
jgi:hypothetical protein